MRDRRRGLNGGSVAVAEEAEDDLPQPSAAELQEDLGQLEHSYDAWHLALERLWEIEQEGPLSEPNFGRKQWLEYQMVQNLQAQEKLRPQLAHAQLTEAVYAAREQHDALVEAVIAEAETVIATLAELGAAVQRFVALIEQQMGGLELLRSHNGHAAFDLRSGRQEAMDLVLRAYPADHRAGDLVNLLLDAPPTLGQGLDAMAGSPRFQPFSPRALERYLASVTPEGATNGSHP
jgi:hypothetical protein